VIFSSHVLSEVETACDRVAILRQGALVHTQTVSHVRRQHRIRARLFLIAAAGALTLSMPVIAQVMEGAAEPAVRLTVPIQVDAHAAKNWDEAH
jgi:ABC-type uncharacterized transport system ATPase subunit